MKLYYFDAPGRAEAIRLLLTHANIKFEDIRFKPTEWPAHKDQFELKQLPVLEIDGKKLSQSYAILEYLGAKYGYLPEGFDKMYKTIFVMNTAEDLFLRAYTVMSPQSYYDEKTKAEAKERLLKVEGPLFLGALEKQLKENCSQDFIVGNRYTIADFFLLGFYRHIQTNEDWSKTFEPKLVDCPLLHAYLNKRLRDFNPYLKKCKTKLYYFDGAGRAEMIRVMLKYLNFPYEDIRIKFDQWPAEKASGKFPLQQLPVVECEPCCAHMCQTDAIMHKIGARFGLLPLNKPEKLYNVVWWCNTLKDIMDNCARFFLPIPEAKKAELRRDFFTKNLPACLDAMENRLKLNKTQCHLVGRSYTVADFYLIGVWRGFFNNPMFAEFKEIVPKYPLLNAYFEKKNQLF